VRLDILYGLMKHFDRVHIGYLRFDDVQRPKKQPLRDGLFSIPHQAVNKLAGQERVVTRISL
jgi:hypothetical protein